MLKESLPADDPRIALPLYTVAEAASALGVPPTTFATWVKGYVRDRPDGGRTYGDALVAHTDSLPRSAPSVPFIGLAEGLVLSAFRHVGVPLQRIRPALQALSSEFGIEHALASKRLYTDGAEVLVDVAEHLDDDGDIGRSINDLVVIRNGQRVFTDVVSSYLKRIRFAPDGFAKLIRLPLYEDADVVADPKRSFGQPIFESGGVRVRDVLERFWAGEKLTEVADDFGIRLSDVEDVVRVTSRRAA
jgi:uncharacterized protein (DUF433 family)